MVAPPGPTKRPVCPQCRKPTRICLCTRLKTPVLDNSVAVTILQHKLEENHPLNSTRIATLGLKNVDVVSVSDVNFDARFVIHPLPRQMSDNRCDSCDIGAAALRGLEENADNKGFSDSPEKKDTIFGHFDEELGQGNDFVFSIDKYGSIKSNSGFWISASQCQEKATFDLLEASASAVKSWRNGFSVKKFQRESLSGNLELEEVEEFEINIPPGSVLLFPSEKAVGIEDIDFEVKNLIVLDGTWAKAKRMYGENPWLRFVPHLKLALGEESLYREVRHQPKAGFLSTIESIVYAMKAVSEDSAELDGLLDVFESMIGDQRRCKRERLINVSADS